MAHQLSIRLPDDLAEAIDRACSKLGVGRSEVVRAALRDYLRAFGNRARPADNVRELIGSLDSGVPDLAERHREYILESLRRGR